jgi:hypothetical protein
MSYIIAFGSYGNETKTYPVNCWRTDIKAGDAVVVQQGHEGSPLKRAVVVATHYLNWTCQHSIACLASEARFDSLGITLPKPTPYVSGLSRAEALKARLKQTGWQQHLPVSRQFKSAHSFYNSQQHANIFMRANGIDIQIIDSHENEALTRDRRLSFMFREHFRIVRHTLSHSGVNLFELTAQFADRFRDGAGSYDEFLKPVGRSDKRTDELRQMAEEGREGTDLYAALGGFGGEPIYVGDGLYLSAGGRWT